MEEESGGKKKVARAFRKRMARATGLRHVLDGFGRSRSEKRQSRKASEKAEMDALMRAAKPPPRPPSEAEPAQAPASTRPSRPPPIQPPPIQPVQPPPVAPVLQPVEPVVRAEEEAKKKDEALPSGIIDAEPVTEPVVAEIVEEFEDKGYEKAYEDKSAEKMAVESAEARKRKAEGDVAGEPSYEEKIEDAIALVLDPGSHTTRAGAAGAEDPEVEVLSVAGRRKATMDGGLPEESFGADAERASTAYDLVRPVESSSVVDWDAAERLWRHALYSVEQKSDKVIVTTGVLCAKATLERLTHMCFEQLGFEFAHCGVAAVLALFGAGFTTGVVVDCGLDSSRVVPVYDGFALPHAIEVDPALGGASVDLKAARLLETKGLAFRSSKAAKIAGEACKLQAAIVAVDPDDFVEPAHVKLPVRQLAAGSRDKDLVEISPAERLEMGECVFVPQVANRSTESPGLADRVRAAVTKAPIDIRRELYAGIMCVGGTSLLPGLPDRLEKDLKLNLADNVHVAVSAFENRHHAAFAGAAMVASLPDFANSWVSRDDASDSASLGIRLDQLSYNC